MTTSVLWSLSHHFVYCYHDLVIIRVNHVKNILAVNKVFFLVNKMCENNDTDENVTFFYNIELNLTSFGRCLSYY